MDIQKNNIPLVSLIPNFVTLLALCLGSTAIRYSLDLKYEIAVSLIVIAAIIDGLDGRIARFLNSSSNFGAQLDSLADLVNFGIAPSITIYIWSLSNIPYKGIGWAVVLFYIVCSAFRLARFNVEIDSTSSVKPGLSTFKGVPMPVAASLILVPMIISFSSHDIIIPSSIMAIYVIAIGLLMVASIPTFSIKNMKIRRDNLPFTIAVLGAIITIALLEPWVILPIIGCVYLISIPVCLFYKKKKPILYVTNNEK